MCSLWSNWQYGSIGSDNGLAPARREAIIWSNVGMLYWRIYASLGLNELKHAVVYAGMKQTNMCRDTNDWNNSTPVYPTILV